MAKAGYVQLRRGLFEHVKDGRLSFFEASLYVAILSDANPATGVCFGSAGLYAAVFSLNPRTCRDALEGLEKKGYLKRFTTRGSHKSYPILVNKFMCSDGAVKGKYVNSDKSADYEHIVYESREDDVEGDVEDGVNEGAASKRIENREKNIAAEAIYEAYPRHVAKAAALKAIQKALTTHDSDWLLARTRAYAESRKWQDEQYTPYPSTWFNRGSYDDETLQPKQQTLYVREDNTVVTK